MPGLNVRVRYWFRYTLCDNGNAGYTLSAYCSVGISGPNDFADTVFPCGYVLSLSVYGGPGQREDD
jgi:hypothetical protein